MPAAPTAMDARHAAEAPALEQSASTARGAASEDQDPADAEALAEASGEDKPRSIGSRALSGGVWTVIAFGGGQGVRLLSNILLAQVLLSEDFGLMGLVSIVMAGLLMFSDIGIGPAIIQNKRTDADFLNTAWTLQVGRGLLLWGAAAALAGLAEELLQAPGLAVILPVVGFTALIQGLQSTNWFTANRNLSVRRMMSIELGTVVVQAVVMVAWAYLVSASVWALVAGGIASTLFHTALSHLLPGIRNRFRLDRSALRELVRFGRWLFLSTILTFFSMHIDKLLLVRFTSTQTFGVFFIGQQLANLGPAVAGKIGQLVGFPALSEVFRERPRDFQRVFLKLRLFTILPIHALLLVMILLGPSLFYVFYPVRFWGAGWIVQLLAVAGIASLVNRSYGATYMATGNPFLNMSIVAAQVVITVSAVLTGYAIAGESGFLMALVVAQLLYYPVDAFLSGRIGVWQPRFDLPALIVSLSLAAGCLLLSGSFIAPSIALGVEARELVAEAEAAARELVGLPPEPDAAAGTADPGGPASPP